MSQITWGISKRNKRTMIIDGHDFMKKQTTKQLNTGDARDTVPTSAECSL